MKVQGPKEREFREIFRTGTMFYVLALFRKKGRFVEGNQNLVRNTILWTESSISSITGSSAPV